MKGKREPVDRETFIKNVKKVRMPFVKKVKPETIADRIISMTPDEIQQEIEEHMDSIERCHCSLELKDRRRDGRDKDC